MERFFSAAYLKAVEGLDRTYLMSTGFSPRLDIIKSRTYPEGLFEIFFIISSFIVYLSNWIIIIVSSLSGERASP